MFGILLMNPMKLNGSMGALSTIGGFDPES